MFDALALDSTLAGGVLVLFVFAFLRFGNRVVDVLLAYRSSPVDAVERTLPENR